MGIFDSVGAAIGIGGAKVKLDLPPGLATALPQGDVLPGRVAVTGGKVQQHVQGINIGLVEVWEETESYREHDGDYRTRTITHRDIHDELRISDAGHVGPGDQRSYDFELNVPLNADLSSRWELVANLEIDGAVDAGDTVRLTIVPSPPMQALDRAMRAGLGWTNNGFTGGDGAVYATYYPPKHLTGSFDEIRVEMANQENRLAVKLTLDLQEKTWKDSLGALVGKDNRYENLAFPYEEIVDDEGEPMPDVITTAVSQLIDKYK